MTNVLENLQLEELSIQEQKDLKGGVPPLLVYGAYLAAGIAVGFAIRYYS